MHYTKSCGGFSLAPSEGEGWGGGCSVSSYPAVLAVKGKYFPLAAL